MSTVRTDLCAEYVPYVFGGQLDEWTFVQPGAWTGTAWPCPGVTAARTADGTDLGIRIECTCGCHTGALEHELPAHCAPRVGVHPTEVAR